MNFIQKKGCTKLQVPLDYRVGKNSGALRYLVQTPTVKFFIPFIAICTRNLIAGAVFLIAAKPRALPTLLLNIRLLRNLNKNFYIQAKMIIYLDASI